MKLCMGCMENIPDNVTTCPYCGYDETTLRQESYYLDPGTVLGGKYIVGRVLSYGGYTVSYLGMDAEANRKITIKEYLPSDFSTRAEGEMEVTIYSGDALEQFNQGLTTFLNEANRIQHLGNVQGIAKVYDCLAQNDTGYVISEYLEGQTLKEILDGGKKYTPQEAKEFICQILTGLCQVHPLDIIHCDIAPETIMVTSTGEIKLLDFGATRYVTTANSKSLAIILKQGYAPEEQYRSRGVRGPWTDVYALGAVMYRMITGKVPEESVDRALVDELQTPTKLGVAIPANMENALMNALNVYQNERTPSAEVFLRELQSAQVKRIQVKKRKNDTGKFPKWAKGLVAGLLCLALAGGVTAYVMWPETETQGTSREQKMPDLKGKTIEEARVLIENGDYKKYGINIEVEEVPDFEYDSDSSKNGKICSQVCEGVETQGAVLEENKDYKVSCTTYSSEKIHYSDLGDTLNAKIIQETLNLPDEKMKPEEANEKSGHMWWDLRQISLNNGQSVTEEELGKKENAAKVLEVAAIKEVVYYESAFFYYKSLPKFENLNVSVPLWKYGKDEKPKKIGKSINLLDSNIVDKNYYSFSREKYEILEQTEEPGTEYNTAEGSSLYFLKVVAQRLAGTGEKVKDVCGKLSGFDKVTVKVNNTVVDKKNPANVAEFIIQKTPEVKSVKDGKEETVEVFSKNAENYVIYLEANAPTPEPTRYVAPQPQQPQGGTNPKPRTRVNPKEKTSHKKPKPSDNIF